MQRKLSIATWNVGRPGVDETALILAEIRRIDADIWILTETHEGVDLTDSHHGVLSDPPPKEAAENRAAIWCRWPVKQIVPTFSPTRAVCVAVETPLGELLIYGTVIAGGPPDWERHYRSLQAHGEDWARIRQAHPDRPLCVAGNFKETLDGSGWQGTDQGRALLAEQLRRNHLVCVTEEDMIVSGKLTTQHNVDHIFLSEGWFHEVHVGAWEGYSPTGQKLSEHNGVLVELDQRPKA